MSRHIDTGMLDQLLGYHLRRTQARVFDDFMRTLADDKVSPGQFGVLTLIGANQGLNQSTLAQAIGIERSTMVAVLTTLQNRGLVERTPAPDDKRANVLSLTPVGRGLLDKVSPLVRNHEKRVFDALTAKERQTLMALLKKVSG